MATATKKDRSPAKTRRRERSAPGTTSMHFSTCQDNSNAYHWELVADDGTSLARSPSFPSRGTAEQAVQRVRADAASARFDTATDSRGVAGPIARENGAANESDAERWLDEGGSLVRDAVAK